MRAVIVDDLGKAPQVHDVPRPSEASGLCHTDIHAARGDWSVQPHLMPVRIVFEFAGA